MLWTIYIMRMAWTIQMLEMKMEKKTETEAFQKLAKGNFRKRRRKINVKKSQIEATTIMEIIKLKKNRSSHQRCSIKINVLKNFAKFTGKYLCHSLFFSKVAGLKRKIYRKTPVPESLCTGVFLWILRNF